MEIKAKHIVIILLLFSFSCKEKTEIKTNKNNISLQAKKDTLQKATENHSKQVTFYDQKKIFDFETSVANISLLNSESLLELINAPKFIENEKGSFPELIIFNKDKTEKLTLLFYPGSKKNEVSYFILEKNNSKSNTHVNKENTFYLDINNFKTNNEIAIGINNELLKTKYLSKNITLKVEKGKNGEKILSFLLDDFENPFLSSYNMPIYSAKYYIVNNKIDKLEFGFIYP